METSPFFVAAEIVIPSVRTYSVVGRIPVRNAEQDVSRERIGKSRSALIFLTRSSPLVFVQFFNGAVGQNDNREHANGSPKGKAQAVRKRGARHFHIGRLNTATASREAPCV